ncbi:hypothetical protein AB5I41_04395 [Sphingomonas sp. MMS24-JH45]
MGIDRDFTTAFAKAQLGAMTAPSQRRRGVRQREGRRQADDPPRRDLVAAGFTIVATGGTADYLARAGVPVETVNKVAQGRPHIVDRIKDGAIDLIFNTTEGWQSFGLLQLIRASAVNGKVPYFTTASASVEAAKAIRADALANLEVLQVDHSLPH